MPKNPLVRMLLLAVMVIWLVYDMASAIEAPSQGVEILHYGLLAGLLIGLIGTGIQLAPQKSGSKG